MPAPALAGRGRRARRAFAASPRARRSPALALLGLLLLIVAPLALLSSGGSAGPATRARPGFPRRSCRSTASPPRAFGLNWLVLAAVHQQETGFSTHPTTYRGVNFAGCCAGPFQFNVTNGPPSTWDGHKHAFRRGHRPDSYPHPQAPHPSVYDDFDAGMAAGSLLRGQRRRRARSAPGPSKPCAPTTAPAPSPTPTPDRVLDRARQWQTTTAPVSGDNGAPAAGAVRGGDALHWPVRGPVTSPFGDALGAACTPGSTSPRRPARRSWPPPRAGVTTKGPVSGYGLYTCLEHTPPVLDLLRAPVAARAHTPRRHRRRAARSSATSAAPATASARTCTSKSASPANPSTRSPTSPGRDEMTPRRTLLLAALIVLAGCQDPYADARAPTTRIAHGRRPRPIRRRGTTRPRATRRSRRRPDHPRRRAGDRASRRQRVLRAMGELGLAHDRTPAATARLRSRPDRSRASSRPKPELRAQDQALRRDKPRHPRARRRDRRQTRGATRRDAVCVTIGATDHRRARRPRGRAPPRLPRHHRAHPQRLGGQPMAAAALAARIPLPHAARSPSATRAAGWRSTNPAARSSPSAALVGGVGRLDARALPRPPSGTREPRAGAAHRARRRAEPASPRSPATPRRFCLPRLAQQRRRRAGARAAVRRARARAAPGRLRARPRRASRARRISTPCCASPRRPRPRRSSTAGPTGTRAGPVLDAATHIVWTLHRHRTAPRARRAPARQRRRSPPPGAARELLVAIAARAAPARQRARAAPARRAALRPTRPHPSLRRARPRRRSTTRQRRLGRDAHRPRPDPPERAGERSRRPAPRAPRWTSPPTRLACASAATLVIAAAAPPRSRSPASPTTPDAPCSSTSPASSARPPRRCGIALHNARLAAGALLCAAVVPRLAAARSAARST